MPSPTSGAPISYTTSRDLTQRKCVVIAHACMRPPTRGGVRAVSRDGLGEPPCGVVCADGGRRADRGSGRGRSCEQVTSAEAASLAGIRGLDARPALFFTRERSLVGT